MKSKTLCCILAISILLIGGCGKKDSNEVIETLPEDVLSEDILGDSETLNIIERDTEDFSEDLSDWSDLFGEVAITESEEAETETMSQTAEDDKGVGVGYMNFGDSTLPSASPSTGSVVHEHDFKLVRTDTSKSCTEGATSYYECECGESKTEVGMSSGHQFVDSVIEPTCQREGYTEKKCSVCGYSMKIDKTPKISHKLETTSVQDPTCLIEGINKTYCTLCGEITQYANVSALGHDWKEVSKDADCKPGGKVVSECQRCHQKQTVNLSGTHQWSAWTETTKATCTKKGVQTRTCSVCKTTETKDLDMIAHTEGSWTTEEESTCTKKGYRVKKCTVCKAEVKRETLELEAHNTGDWIIDYSATCTSEGKRHKHCSKCNKDVNIEKITKKEHSGTWQVVVPATCISEGSREYVCDSCGETVNTGVIAKKPHSLVQVSSKLPTCEEEGYVEFRCTVCNSVECIPAVAKGHSPDNDGVCRICGKKVIVE